MADITQLAEYTNGLLHRDRPGILAIPAIGVVVRVAVTSRMVELLASATQILPASSIATPEEQ